MGGSAISGMIYKDIIKDYLDIPIEVYSQEKLPDYIDKETLFIPISYSGTTKETLNMKKNVREAKKIGISSNRNFCKETLYIPGELPPRYGFYYMFSLLLSFSSDLFSKRKIKSALKKTAAAVKENIKRFKKKNSLPYNIALELRDSPILIYAPSIFKSVAYRWKTQFNENSKAYAFSNYFPEFSHNEIVPFIKGKNNFKIITLRSAYETEIETKEMDFFKDFVDFEIEFASSNSIEELVKFVILGDFVSYYLADINNVDPYDITMIDDLKKYIKSK
jgi:glucose/mannose-6-phosphate isomerase